MPLQDAEGLRAFLREATIAYANNGPPEDEKVDGTLMSTYTDGSYRLRDTYAVSSDLRGYNGREEVFKNGMRIWAAGYHGQIVESADPEEVLKLYSEALKRPDPELPIRGPQKLVIGDGEFEYTLDSTHGPLKIARFAVIEEIKRRGSRVYRGDITGGWL